MRIRKMTASDVPSVAAIERESFSRPWSERSFLEAVADKNAYFLTALSSVPDAPADGGGLVAGYIGMYVSPPEGEITNVAVAEAFRGKGFGTALVAAVQEAAVSLGIGQLFLEVRDSNAAAIRLYEHSGFAEIGVRKGFYDFPREDARIMRWNRT
ncbi:MAG: ribosomal protein S18-alanine N-acetyltransferase [Muribaculaceae bacterium]|nr:ribosomal protein S18-alanine N-acetyltransferase [Roseburia sp.]MCM1432239.1 ribosomal protein S18-alanine N-acetyltransferase [Muribaculaceae bacterium]MCM1491984.1 ribosomal protein S18-alanine N-acetyltransferase [Muribaculaceae bacterium]